MLLVLAGPAEENLVLHDIVISMSASMFLKGDLLPGTGCGYCPMGSTCLS